MLFSNEIDKLFDIAHRDSETMTGDFRVSTEDLKFLHDQRTERKMIIAGVDRKLTSIENRKSVRHARELERRDREMKRLSEEKAVCSGVQLSDTDSDNQVANVRDHCDDDTFIPTSLMCNGKSQAKSEAITVTLKRNICDSVQVTESADRHGLSNRQLFATVASIIKSSNTRIDNFFISPSSVKRARVNNREIEASKIKEHFSQHCSTQLVVHWLGYKTG